MLFCTKLAAIMSLLAIASANRVKLDQGLHRQVCEGMYAKADWGGNKSPHIQIDLSLLGNDIWDPSKPAEEQKSENVVSYVIFEYKDLDRLGKPYSKTGFKKYICDDIAVSDGLCGTEEYGNFMADGDVTNTTIQIAQISHLGSANITYPVLRTGYYCVSTFMPSDVRRYSGSVNFQNAFGELSASEIPKLLAYGILTLCYAATLALYAFQFFKKRDQNQILPLQKYLLAMLAFLTFDTLVIWSYFDLVNRTTGKSLFVDIYAGFLSLLSSAKITFCFFLLLLIGLGYGVVVLKLPKKIMFRCKLLAAAHFTASMIYLLGSYYFNPSNSATSSSDILEDGADVSLWAILPLIPISVTLAAYYILILTSIRKTTATLHKQRQVIKLQLYESLFRIIIFAGVLTIGGIVFSSFIFLSLSSTEIIELNWKGSYFVFEFWPSVTFFGIFLGVAWLWRPTETSYMLAVSHQISANEGEDGEGGENSYQHGHEFELDDVSLMSHSDAENEDRDSFELNSQSIPKTDPPTYQTVSQMDGTSFDTPAANNTYFELGDGEDDHKDHDVEAQLDDQSKKT